MLLSYLQKRGLIDHFANRANWTNHFDAAFFMDDARKGNTRRHGDVNVNLNDKGTKARLEHVVDHTGLASTDLGVLYIEKTHAGIALHDESARSMAIANCGILAGPDVEISPIRPLPVPESHVIHVEPMGLHVYFTKTGSKTVLFEKQGLEARWSGAVRETQAHNHHAFSLAIPLDRTLAQHLDMPIGHLGMASNLVLARDFGIEPDLVVQNELDENSALAAMMEYEKNPWDMDWQGPWQWRPKVKMSLKGKTIVKPVDDTTDMSERGYVDAPRHFRVEKETEGYSVWMPFDRRETVWSQAHVLNATLTGDDAPVASLRNNMSGENLVNMLAMAQPVQDHTGREWHAMLVRASTSVAMLMRSTARTELALHSNDYAVLSYDKNHYLLAIAADQIEPAREKFAAHIGELDRAPEPEKPARTATVTTLQPRPRAPQAPAAPHPGLI